MRRQVDASKKKRDMPQLFDLVIKALLQETSSPNTVRLINAFFGRSYPDETPVNFVKTESVKNRGKTLNLFRADVIINIEEYDYAIEFQIDNDNLIGLRLFEYSFMYASTKKRVKENGALIEMDLSDACVIYFESSGTTPDNVTFRLRNQRNGKSLDYDVKVFKMAEQTLKGLETQKLLLLLPFCILKFRKELEKLGLSSKDRKAIAREEQAMFYEIEAILLRNKDKEIVTRRDCMLILENLSRMHDELYRKYSEFEEATMVMKDSIIYKWDLREKEFEKRLAKAERAELMAQKKAERAELAAQRAELMAQKKAERAELAAQRAELMAQKKAERAELAAQKKTKQATSKILKLWKKGYTPEEVERMLAEEEKAKSPDN